MEKTQNWPYLWPRHNAKHLGACFHATEEAPLLSIEEFQIQLSSSSLRAEIREVLLEMSQNIPWPPLGKVHSEFHIDQFGGWVLRFFQLFLTEFPNLLAGSNEPCKKEELSKVKNIIWKASTLGHHLYDTCSIATKFLPWGCLAECPVWRHSHWRHSAELRWQARSSACSPARSLLKTSLWHCNQQCVKKLIGRQLKQLIYYLLRERVEETKAKVFTYLKSCLRSSWALLKIGSRSLSLLFRSTELQPAMQAAWEKTYFPNSLCKQRPIQNSIAQGPRFKTKKLRCKLRCWPCWSLSSSQGPRLQRSWAEQR